MRVGKVVMPKGMGVRVARGVMASVTTGVPVGSAATSVLLRLQPAHSSTTTIHA